MFLQDVGSQGSDWFFLNEQRGPGGDSGSDVAWLDSLAAANATGLLTITTIGWVACSGGVDGPACADKAPASQWPSTARSSRRSVRVVTRLGAPPMRATACG